METIAFAGDGLCADLVPAEELADCAATVLERDGRRILSYGSGAGYTPLREQFAARFGVSPDRVILTNGWLQGFVLLARLSWHQHVFVEYPTDARALRLLLSRGSNVLYVDLFPDGPLVDQIAVQLRTNPKGAFLYTIPTFHNPTGQTLTLDQRIAIAQLLFRNRTYGLEDDSYGLLRYEGDPLPTLFEVSGGRSIYGTSFSYTIAPGLRVGVFVVPHAFVDAVTQQAASNYISPSLIAQATVFEFIRRGSFETHLEQLKKELADRRDAMLAALETHLEDASWVRPEGGVYLMLTFPPDVNAKRALERAEGVSALAGDDFYGRPNTVRLNFAACGRDEIEPGIERLAAAFALEPV